MGKTRRKKHNRGHHGGNRHQAEANFGPFAPAEKDVQSARDRFIMIAAGTLKNMHGERKRELGMTNIHGSFTKDAERLVKSLFAVMIGRKTDVKDLFEELNRGHAALLSGFKAHIASCMKEMYVPELFQDDRDFAADAGVFTDQLAVTCRDCLKPDDMVRVAEVYDGVLQFDLAQSASRAGDGVVALIGRAAMANFVFNKRNKIPADW